MEDDAIQRHSAMTPSEAAVLLVRELEGILHSNGVMQIQEEEERHENIRFQDFEWDATWHGVPYGQAHYRVVSVTVVLHVRKPGSKEPRQDDASQGHGAKLHGVMRAIVEEWPHGVPPGLSGKEQDARLRVRIEANGDSVPVDMKKARERALAMLSEDNSQRWPRR